MKKKINYLVLFLIICASAFFRFVDLDHATMGADVMEFYKIGQAEIAPFELIRNSPAYIGRMPPFWFAAHNWFLQTFRLDVSFGNMRILDAITGVLTVLAFFWLGKGVGGAVFGLLAAFYVAMHPFHIQMSRECYFYAPIVLGCVLMLRAITRLVDSQDENKMPGFGFFLLVFSGFFLITNVQISSWAFAGISGIALYSLLLPPVIKKTQSWRTVAVITVGFFLLGLPTLMSEWGMADVIHLMRGDGRDHWSAVFGDKKAGVFSSESVTLLSGFLFGRGWIRGVLNILFLAFAGWRGVVLWRKDRRTRVFIKVFGGVFALLFYMHAKSIFPPASRHYASLYPFFVIFVCMGFMQLVALVGKHAGCIRQAMPAAWAFCFVLVALLFGRPALWSMRVEAGSPWRQVARWSDENLPPNTVVLCDRWFTPWNELNVNASTNVHFTFTIPNEPPDVYMENRWRESAMNYLRANPFAAYLDRKQYWDRIGPWEEPYELFARKEVFVDEANIKLDDMGLAYRAPPSDTPREWQDITVFYNTEDDVLDRARRTGKTTLLAFGPDWGYLKPWRPMQGWSEQMIQMLWIQAGMFLENGRTLQDLSELNQLSQAEAIRYLNQGRWADYRTPSTKSDLYVYNLTDRELKAELQLVGVALSGPVRIRAANRMVDFPASLMVEHQVLLSLQPGRQSVQFAVRPEQFMLILHAKITAVPDEPPAGI